MERLHLAIRIGWALAACLTAVGCGSGTPISPDPRIPSTTSQPTSIKVVCLPSGNETRCRATANWGGYPYAAESRDVTVEAEWASSAPAVARVKASGVIVAEGRGDADIVVRFQGGVGHRGLRVFPAEPPLALLDAYEFSVVVRDGKGNAVVNAKVEVVSGHNAGGTWHTDQWGMAAPPAGLVYGPARVRISKEGYQEAVAQGVIGGPWFPTVVITSLPS